MLETTAVRQCRESCRRLVRLGTAPPCRPQGGRGRQLVRLGPVPINDGIGTWAVSARVSRLPLHLAHPDPGNYDVPGLCGLPLTMLITSDMVPGGEEEIRGGDALR